MKTTKFQGVTLVVPQSLTDKRLMSQMLGQDVSFVQQTNDNARDRLLDFAEPSVQDNGKATLKITVNLDSDSDDEYELAITCVLEEVREEGESPWYSASVLLPTNEIVDFGDFFQDVQRLASLAGLDPTNFPEPSKDQGRWVSIREEIQQYFGTSR